MVKCGQDMKIQILNRHKFNLILTIVHMGPTHKVDVADDAKFLDVENIYQELEELPLGSSANYPDIKTTVL